MDFNKACWEDGEWAKEDLILVWIWTKGSIQDLYLKRTVGRDVHSAEYHSSCRIFMLQVGLCISNRITAVSDQCNHLDCVHWDKALFVTISTKWNYGKVTILKTKFYSYFIFP